jgi:hypothetical protein
MQQALVGSINSAVGLQKIPIKEEIMFSHLFIRVTATLLATTPTTLDDFGTFKLKTNKGESVNCTGSMLFFLNSILGGNPVHTPGTTAGTPVEFYISIPRRLPGETNVDYLQTSENPVFEWEPGPNLNGRLTTGTFMMVVNYIPAMGVKVYDLYLRRMTKPMVGTQRDALTVDEENIALLFLSDAAAALETLASGNLQAGYVGVTMGPMKSYSSVQEAISAQQTFHRLEGAADYTNMVCIFDAALVGEGYAADLFDNALVEIQNGPAGVATAAILSVSKRMRNEAKQRSREFVNSQTVIIANQARKNGATSKIAAMKEAQLVID